MLFKEKSWKFKVIFLTTTIITSSVVGLIGWKLSSLPNTLATTSKSSLITQPIRSIKGHSGWVYAVAISPDGKTLVSGGYDGTIKIWNLHTGELLNSIKGHDDAAESLAISSDGRMLVSGSWDNRIKLWNLKTSKLIRTFSGHLDDVESVAISPDGKQIVSSSWDQTIKLWNVDTGKVIWTLQQQSPVRTVAISPDGQLLASGNEHGKVMIWHLKTGKLKTPLAAHDNAVWSVAFSRDGRTLASGSYDQTIKLWNTQTGELLHTCSGHHNAVWSVAFSPDGKQIASGSYDRTIKLWNAQTGQLLNTLVGHTKAVWSVAFNPQGHTLASGSADETTKIWQVPSKAPITTPPSVSQLAAVLTQQPESTNWSLLYDLTQKVYNQVNQTWQQRGLSEENLIYRLGVGIDGGILGYQLVNSDGSQLSKQTTKNDLLYKLVKRRPATREAIVHFKVVFTKQGILEVSPWRGHNTTN